MSSAARDAPGSGGLSCRRTSDRQPICSGAESFLAGTASCRIEVSDVDALFAELQSAGVLHHVSLAAVNATDFGTREFATLDSDGNLLTFFCWNEPRSAGRRPRLRRLRPPSRPRPNESNGHWFSERRQLPRADCLKPSSAARRRRVGRVHARAPGCPNRDPPRPRGPRPPGVGDDGRARNRPRDLRRRGHAARALPGRVPPGLARTPRDALVEDPPPVPAIGRRCGGYAGRRLGHNEADIRRLREEGSS